MNLQLLFDKVLSRHIPQKSAQKKIVNIVSQLNAALAAKGIDATTMLGGSVAKNTHLSLYDCDIFVLFSEKYRDEDISTRLAQSLPFPFKLLHGSRDYFQMEKGGIIFEFIPVLKIKSPNDFLNVTDLSPFHVIWVNKHIAKMHNDVRLAKLFCIAQNMYGAESHIGGFSGYMLEILIIYYGGFLPFLNAAAKFTPKQIIDVNHVYKSKDDLFAQMNAAKLQSPLIAVDPVQPKRNAAAAVSKETFSRLVLAAKLFLNAPSSAFFGKKSFSLSKIRKLAKKTGTKLLLFSVIPREGKTDIVGGKLLKTFEYISTQLTLAGFSLLDKGWHWDKDALFWYLVYPQTLPRAVRHQGPLVYSSLHHLLAFIKKHKTFIVENDRLIALRKRHIITLSVFAHRIVRDSFVKEQLKKISIHP